MEPLLVLVVAVAALVGGLFLGVRARPRATSEGPGIEAALGAALTQLTSTNRAWLEGERARSTEQLDGKKSLIDQQLHAMTGELSKVSDLVRSLERDRATQYGRLASALRLNTEGLGALTDTTQSLREALSSTKARGQWGERMAEDVLRLAGFVEGVNYRKQRAVTNGRGIPDFTFLLPSDLALYMDVKFPLDNYLRYLDANTDLDRERFRSDFLRDVRLRVKELATRDYARNGDVAVDCVLLFIPNEQLYGFIQEQDATILDDALRNQVVFCSPLTLFAILAVIRQAVDNFRLERTSSEILVQLAAFKKQWSLFVDRMDKLDRSLGAARRDYDELVTTRRRQLERPLERIETLGLDRSLSGHQHNGEGTGAEVSSAATERGVVPGATVPREATRPSR